MRSFSRRSLYYSNSELSQPLPPISNPHLLLSICGSLNSSCQTNSQPGRAHSGVGVAVGAGVLVGAKSPRLHEMLKTIGVNAARNKNKRPENPILITESLFLFAE